MRFCLFLARKKDVKTIVPGLDVLWAMISYIKWALSEELH